MAHALLSASDSKRWLNCTPAPRLTEHLPDKQTEATLEGTTAHAIAELKVRKALVEPMGPRTFSNRLKKLKEMPFYNDEMLRHTDTYLDYIQSVVHSFDGPAHVVVEKRLDYSNYAPEGFGTADCILIHNKGLWVIDFKYGKGVPVSAEENPQMSLYSLGAINAYGFVYPIETVHMAIVQPRLDSVSEWQITRTELERWGNEVVKPRAELAFKGEGEFSPSEDTCRWCGIRPTCRYAYKAATAVSDFADKEPATLSAAEVSEALEKGKQLVSWYKSLEDYALTTVLSGGEIPGYKAVAGRAVRSFTDGDAALERIQNAGWKEELLYERKPLSLAALEKLVGKQAFVDICSDLIVMPPGKPTLVPESDKRPPLKPISAQEDFGGSNATN